jgi:hypothetical protein
VAAERAATVGKDGAAQMIFEHVTIQDIPVMFISEYGVPPVSAPRAFDRLESALPSLRGRKFYGTFDPSTSEYRACVALQEGDHPEAVGCSRGIIAGGVYLRARLRGELDKTTPRISGTFAAMAVAAAPDPSRRAVEFYRRSDELDLLFPVLS